MKNILADIASTQAEMQRSKPRSRRFTELELRLKQLRIKQLKSEIRASKRRAA